MVVCMYGSVDKIQCAEGLVDLDVGGGEEGTLGCPYDHLLCACSLVSFK